MAGRLPGRVQGTSELDPAVTANLFKRRKIGPFLCFGTKDSPALLALNGSDLVFIVQRLIAALKHLPALPECPVEPDAVSHV